MTKNRSAQRRQGSPSRRTEPMEQTVLVRRHSQASDMNDNDPWTREELAALGSAVSSQAAMIDRAVLSFDSIKQQVTSVSVRFEGLKADERLTSLEYRLQPLTDTQSKIDAIASKLDQTQRDLRSAIDELKTAQAKQDTQLTVLKYVVNAIAIFAIGAAGHAAGPKLLELVMAALK